MLVRKSPNADNRTMTPEADKEELFRSTQSHIEDVSNGLKFISNALIERGSIHDHTKIENIDEFYTALRSGHIKDTDWYQKHITKERHHLKSHIPEDVNIIDVVEHLVDCTMAGLTRSGTIYDVDLSTDVLQLAVQNTVELLKKNTTVIEDNDDVLNTPISD